MDKDRPSDKLDALHRSRKIVERRVRAETSALTKANQALQAEIAARRRAEDEIRLLLEITQAIGEAQDFQSALQVTLHKICEFTDWGLGLARVRTADDRALEVQAVWHRDNLDLAEFVASCRSYSFARGQGIPGRVWASQQPLWIPDLALQSDLYPLAVLAIKVGFKAVAAVPVFEKDKLTAVLVFSTFEVRERDDRKMDIIASLAAQLGFALHRKRSEEELQAKESLVRRAAEELEVRVQERTAELGKANKSLEIEIAERKRVEEEIKARVAQQAAVAKIGQNALSGTDLFALMQDSSVLVARTLDVEFCKILELLPDGQALLLRSGVGWRPGFVGQATVSAGVRSQAGYTLRCGAPVIVEDLETETRFGGPPLLREHKVVSGISVIIKGRHRPFGVLGVHTSKRRSFSADDIYFLEAVANVLSEAIEQKNIEEKIQRSESWLRNLIATTQDAVVSIDRRGSVVLFNAAAERIFGYAADEIIGRKVNELMAEPYSSEHDDYIARYERTGEPRAIGRIRTVTAKRKTGESFPIELSVTRIAEDQEVRYAAFIRDISEKTRLQSQLIESERLAAIGTTAAKIGHELGNPLNGMSLTIQLLEQRLSRQTNAIDSRTSATVNRLKTEISRLNQLVGQFRTISHKEKYDFRPTSLADVVADVIKLQGPRFEQLGVEIENRISPDLPLMSIDTDKIKQAFLNLTKNAAEAMPGGGKITIEACATDVGVQVAITDTGIGIPLDVDPFEPFTTTKKEGTGIGLVIVRQIIVAHGGTISYQTRPGEGTTFRMELPQR